MALIAIYALTTGYASLEEKQQKFLSSLKQIELETSKAKLTLDASEAKDSIKTLLAEMNRWQKVQEDMAKYDTNISPGSGTYMDELTRQVINLTKKYETLTTRRDELINDELKNSLSETSKALDELIKKSKARADALRACK